jgi:hypothetical protein
MPEGPAFFQVFSHVTTVKGGGTHGRVSRHIEGIECPQCNGTPASSFRRGVLSCLPSFSGSSWSSCGASRTKGWHPRGSAPNVRVRGCIDHDAGGSWSGPHVLSVWRHSAVTSVAIASGTSPCVAAKPFFPSAVVRPSSGFLDAATIAWIQRVPDARRCIMGGHIAATAVELPSLISAPLHW